MKAFLLMGLIIMLVDQSVSTEVSTNSNKDVKAIIGSPPTAILGLPSNKAKFMEMVGRRLKELWARIIPEENSNSFIGRCFGVARKLKFVMPLIIFKLGVIVTAVAFLTIFSLKSLGLLGLLLLINVSGAVSKIAVALSGKHSDAKTWQKPQNVHFHIHKEKEGDYHIGHTGSGWDDRLGKYGSDEDLNNLESYNLYNKLSSNILRNYGDAHR